MIPGSETYTALYQQKWLRVADDVVLTPVIAQVIQKLDERYFARLLKHATVTSGLRDAVHQLEILKRLAIEYGATKLYPEVVNADLDTWSIKPWDNRDLQVYDWQPAWSWLLHNGIIVNPPRPARCLFDYMRDGVNKRGQLIGVSPHFNGTAFDIGGGSNGVQDEMAVIAQAFAEKQIPGLKGFLLERKQNCLHVDCEAVPVVA